MGPDTFDGKLVADWEEYLVLSGYISHGEKRALAPWSNLADKIVKHKQFKGKALLFLHMAKLYSDMKNDNSLRGDVEKKLIAFAPLYLGCNTHHVAKVMNVISHHPYDSGVKARVEELYICATREAGMHASDARFRAMATPSKKLSVLKPRAPAR